MRRTILLVTVVSVSVLALGACIGDTIGTAPDASTDAGLPDGTVSDANGGSDTSTGTDAARPDTGAQDSGSDVSTGTDASDGGVDAADSAPPVDAATYCNFGLAKGDPIGGTVSLFDAEGNPLPAGHYRITYVGGCMVYGGGQAYTVHAYAPATGDASAPAYATWELVYPDGGFIPAALPGFWIFGPDAGVSPASYDACVTLNLTAPPLELDYDAGAPLGVKVNDSPLTDNSAGPDGGVPTWRLERFSQDGGCP